MFDSIDCPCRPTTGQPAPHASSFRDGRLERNGASHRFLPKERALEEPAASAAPLKIDGAGPASAAAAKRAPRSCFALIPLLALTLGAASPALAQDEVSPGEQIRAENCMVKFIHNVDVPAEVEGKLVDLKVDEGDRVSQGDVLAVVDDTAAELTLELKQAQEKEAELNAMNDVNLKDAQNAEELAQAEAESYRELHQKGATPYYEMKKKLLEAVRADLRIDLAEMNMKIAKAQYLAKRHERELAEFELTRRRITAPFDGYIESRIAQLGEWVQPGSPIAQLVQLDRLRVEGDVNALKHAGEVTVGTPVTVRVYSSTSPETAIEMPGKIGFVSSQIDLNNRFRVWVELENRRVANGQWAIKPGMKAEILVHSS